ncbi:hypothetical protein NIES4106_60500 (plasmid) [Fischerella sp. NIES-4106]|nr:hypothetical protein NIES4106_60500 [Fischerella sp. NIES-4106]
MTTSTTETIRLVADLSRQAATDRQTWQAQMREVKDEIREIWRYLRYQPGNGTSEGN